MRKEIQACRVTRGPPVLTGAPSSRMKRAKGYRLVERFAPILHGSTWEQRMLDPLPLRASPLGCPSQLEADGFPGLQPYLNTVTK